jgi:hypothetical protein
MSGLQVTLLIKIIYTAVFWSLPLLFFPAYAARRLHIPEPRPVLFAHLLGAAFTALLVGYVYGLRDSLAGQDIRSVVVVGIVSNASAFLLLVLFAREWRQWGGAPARLYMWASTVLTFVITVGLTFFGLLGG